MGKMNVRCCPLTFNFLKHTHTVNAVDTNTQPRVKVLKSRLGQKKEAGSAILNRATHFYVH